MTSTEVEANIPLPPAEERTRKYENVYKEPVLSDGWPLLLAEDR